MPAGKISRKKDAARKRSGGAGRSPQGRAAARELKLQRQALQAELFQEVCALIKGQVKIQSFLNRLLKRVTKATGATAATLFLLDESGDELEFAVVRGPGSKKLKGRRIPAGEGIAGRVLQTGRPYSTGDVRRDPVWSSRVADEFKLSIRSILAAPLIVGGKPQGVIELIDKKNREPFTRSDLALLKSLAAEAAIGVENTRLLAEAQGQAERFAHLYRVAAILNSSLDPALVRKAAMEAAVELLECETGSLYLIDAEKNELYFEVALGEKGEAVKQIRLKMGEGIAGWVAQEGKSDLVPDTSLDPRWAKRVDEKSKFKTRNMVTVPVKSQDQVIGVLQALNKLGDKKFNSLDLRLLENLADQVAIALENARLYKSQKEMFVETAQALATAIEKRDPYTGGHTRRVRDFSMAAAKYLELPPDDREWLLLAAILHDIGKIGVPDRVLNKPDRLDDSEFALMKSHPGYGYDILRQVKHLARAIPGMKYHHERFDGRGYPEGLAGLDIPRLARIITVADTWDAMTSDRPYRKGLSDQVAAEELIKFSGVQFDPEVVKAFIQAFENHEIRSQHEEEGQAPGSETSDFKPKGIPEEGRTPGPKG
jgi:HD-GYP domain-containing protein (c-di-GMP phosphodiesterase class II)